MGRIRTAIWLLAFTAFAHASVLSRRMLGRRGRDAQARYGHITMLNTRLSCPDHRDWTMRRDDQRVLAAGGFMLFGSQGKHGRAIEFREMMPALGTRPCIRIIPRRLLAGYLVFQQSCAYMRDMEHCEHQRATLSSPTDLANYTAIVREMLPHNTAYEAEYYDPASYRVLSDISTSHMAAVKDGNAVSLTMTVNLGWGSQALTEDG
ncbi:hypothetical protein BDZ89DRAFT_1054869 [Hymenopellis radicata]|nr:hypothetical protein BDZ89DRAFT_1054869 [Hymenopellis radicata]